MSFVLPLKLIILPFSIISKPIESIEAFFEINLDLSLLDAINFFLLKMTLLPYILNLFDLKITFFFNIISSSVKKFPSFAVTEIFCLLLLIENLGRVISAVFLFIITVLSLLVFD